VHARNAESAKSRFFLRVNPLHDMTDAEVKKLFGMKAPDSPRFRATNEDSAQRSVVESLRAGSSSGVADAYSGKSFDWRSKGVFSPIVYRGQCSSCWAWSSAAQVEAAWKIAG
jgi:C1A family cysteine protease